MVRKLLRMGADPNTQDNAGQVFMGSIITYCLSANLSFYRLVTAT